MKKLVIVLYVGCVLLISGFARADVTFQAPAKIEGASFDPSTLVMVVVGTLPTVCYGDPSATMSQYKEDPNTLVVKMYSSVPSGINSCIQLIKEYREDVHLPKLAQASDLEINPNAVYVVKTEGYDFEFKVMGAELLQ